MEKLRLKISPTFVLFACLLIYFGKAILFANYVIVMLLHELSHALVARRLGYNIRDIKIIPFGISLNINSFELAPKDEVKIALAGPICNFFLALCSLALWWIFPETFNYTYMFCYANLITGFFNLIPAFPLDGGRVLRAIFRQKTQGKRAIKFCKIVNVVLAVLLVALFVCSCFNEVNLTYLFVTFCVLSGLFENNAEQKYSLINYGLSKKIGRVVKVKSIMVYETENLFRVAGQIDNFSYLNIFVANADKKIVAVLTENDFIDLLQESSATSTFKAALEIRYK